MFTSILRSFLVLLTLSACALSARAQLTFTATGTATTTAFGYTSGQSYTFVYTTGSSFANNADSTFTGQQKSWSEEFTTENQLFTSISGSGLLGAYIHPVATSFDPSSQLFVGTAGPFFKLQAIANSSSSIGLTSLNATPILLAVVNVTGGMNIFTAGGYVDPVIYFTTNGYSGGYPSATGQIILQGAGFSAIETFNITNLTIAAPIPEPSTYAALLGLSALGLVAWRQRGRAAS